VAARPLLLLPSGVMRQDCHGSLAGFAPACVASGAMLLADTLAAPCARFLQRPCSRGALGRL